jgi:hypothetical protein
VFPLGPSKATVRKGAGDGDPRRAALSGGHRISGKPSRTTTLVHGSFLRR